MPRDPDPPARTPGAARPAFRPPRSTATFGMWIFLAALFMLFAASMVGYAIIRVTGPANVNRGTLHLPPLLWFSTLALVVVSVAVHFALAAARRERQASFRLWLQLMLGAGLAFLAIQGPALWQLLTEHRTLQPTGQHLYGLIFCLVLLHALHVVGGIAWLVRITVQGHRNAYDHEHYLPVRHAAMYWHFLDAVWVVMFSTFLLVG